MFELESRRCLLSSSKLHSYYLHKKNSIPAGNSTSLQKRSILAYFFASLSDNGPIHRILAKASWLERYRPDFFSATPLYPYSVLKKIHKGTTPELAETPRCAPPDSDITAFVSVYEYNIPMKYLICQEYHLFG